MKAISLKTAALIVRIAALVFIALLTVPQRLHAQDAPTQAQEAGTGTPGAAVQAPESRFRKEELAQMLAPLALYPDSLVAQVLMASTYPLEVVEAERWLRNNRNLKADSLDAALQDKEWDPSIKSLCHFPEILFAMSENLDQTRKLGDAFLAQQDDVMTTIQELRKKAEEQGNLAPTQEQKVVTEQGIIRIEPADPQVVYVPSYDPLCVYGPWGYPAYPPYFWYTSRSFFSGSCYYYNPGITLGFNLFAWSWFDWPHRHIRVDHDKARRFHRFRHDGRDADRPFWRHDPSHRKGVAYRDISTSRRFMPSKSFRPLAGPEVRGFTTGPFERPRIQSSRPFEERRREMTTPKAPAERFKTSNGRENPFNRIDNSAFERRASERGGISRERGSGFHRGFGSGRQDRGSPPPRVAPGPGSGKQGGAGPAPKVTPGPWGERGAPSGGSRGSRGGGDHGGGGGKGSRGGGGGKGGGNPWGR